MMIESLLKQKQVRILSTKKAKKEVVNEVKYHGSQSIINDVIDGLSFAQLMQTDNNFLPP